MPACPVPIEECESFLANPQVCGFDVFAPFGSLLDPRSPTDALLSQRFEYMELQFDSERDWPSDCLGGSSRRVLRQSITAGTLLCEQSTVSEEETGCFPPVGGGLTETHFAEGYDGDNYEIELTRETFTSTPYQETQKVIFSGRILDQRAWLMSLAAEITAAAIADSDFTHPRLTRGSSCEAEVEPETFPASAPLWLKVTAVRRQLIVPITHKGTYFKEVFDVIEEPEGWDDVTILRTFYAKDVEREWTGPGTGDQDDPSWLLGAPYDIPPPPGNGVRRVVNRRFWCYPASPYGFKPQITGEGAEIVTPP
jgi:hypothetical protein